MRAYLESVKYFYLWFLFQSLCLLGNFALFLSPADFISKSTFFQKIVIRVSNSLDPDQVQRFASLEVDPNCLQRLSGDNTGRQICCKSPNDPMY